MLAHYLLGDRYEVVVPASRLHGSQSGYDRYDHANYELWSSSGRLPEGEHKDQQANPGYCAESNASQPSPDQNAGEENTKFDPDNGSPSFRWQGLARLFPRRSVL